MFSLNQEVLVLNNLKWIPGKITAVDGNRYYVKFYPPIPLGVSHFEQIVPANLIRATEANTGNMPSHTIAPALPMSLPIAPALPMSLPIAPALPMSLPIAPALPMSLPIAPALPVKGEVEVRPAEGNRLSMIMDEDTHVMSYRSCQDFDFPIEYLKKCENLRQKMWQKIRGSLSATCGYTGPALGILMLLFKNNDIRGKKSLNSFLRNRYRSLISEHGESFKRISEIFMATVNETAGNFLDLCDVTPVTQTRYGLRGLIEEEEISRRQGKVSIVDRSNIVKGPNIISFKTRGLGECTFHHSMIYAIPEEDKCFILDSWMDNATMECRLPTCRQHSFTEVQNALHTLNSSGCTIDGAKRTFRYFMPPYTFLDGIQQGDRFEVYVLDQKYIQIIFSACEFNMVRVFETIFGGYTRKKKNIRTKKSHTRRYIINKKHHTRRQIRAK
jgi:hypothetical protein